MLKDYTESQFSASTADSNTLPEFIKHFGSYYSENKDGFYELYNLENEPLKLLILKSLAYTEDNEALNFLIDKITSVERARSDAAYYSLKKITGKDPAASLKKEKYDIDVVFFFRNYISQMNK